jgi:hypothetical protein
VPSGKIEAATRNGKPSREPAWSESIAVGGKAFIENIKEKLGIKAKGRKTVVIAEQKRRVLSSKNLPCI